ncbi:MAG: hypothetical protein AAGA03_13080 [Planctomycetota bacterium]
MMKRLTSGHTGQFDLILRVAIAGIIASTCTMGVRGEIVSISDGDATFEFDTDITETDDSNALLTVNDVGMLYSTFAFINLGGDNLIQPVSSTSVAGSEAMLQFDGIGGVIDMTITAAIEQTGENSVVGLLNYSLVNVTNAPISGSLITYFDVDLEGDESLDETATFEGDTLSVFDSTSSFEIGGGITSTPNAVQADEYSTLIDALSDNSLTQLDDTGFPRTDDVTVALQYDFEIPANGFTNISQVFSGTAVAIPEPSLLVPCGLCAVSGLLRRRRDVK